MRAVVFLKKNATFECAKTGKRRTLALSLLLALLNMMTTDGMAGTSVPYNPNVDMYSGCSLIPLNGFAANANLTYTVLRYCDVAATALQPYINAGWYFANNCTPYNSNYTHPADTCNAFYPTLLLKVHGCPLDQSLDATGTCVCPVGQEWIPSSGACATLAVPDGPPKSPPVCPVGVGKPIYPLTGTEKYVLDLEVKLGGQMVSATYDTIVRAPVAVAGTELSNTGQGSFGALWATSLHKNIIIGTGNRGARAHCGSGRSGQL